MANVFTIKTFAQISNNSRKPIVWILAVLFSFAFALEVFGAELQFLGALNNHSSNVLSLAFSPDGQLLASGSNDGTIVIQNPQERKVLQTASVQGAVTAVAFSHDGKLLCSGFADGKIEIWALTTKTALYTLSGNGSTVTSVAFSHDGQSLASSSENGAVQSWNVRTGEILRTFEGDTTAVRAVVFRSDGQLLAARLENSTIKLINLQTGEVLSTLESQSTAVSAMAFSPDVYLFASGSEDGVIQVWRTLTGEPLNALTETNTPVRSLAVCADGYLAAVSDNDIPLWRFSAIVITNPPKVVERSDFTFHFSGTDARTKKENLQYSWRLDGKEWSEFSIETSANLRNLTNGLHLFEVRAKNEAGVIDVIPDKVWFEVAIEKVPPETTVLNPPKFIKIPDVTFKFSGEDAQTKKENLQYSWRLDGGGWSKFSTETSTALRILDNGSHLFEVCARDEVGNIDATPAQVWFEVAIDKEPPETEITNPLETVVKTVNFTFKFKGSDNQTKTEGLEYSWCLNGVEWKPFSKETNITLHNLANGEYLFEVRAKDDVGNVDSTPARASFGVSIDQPPNTKILNPPSVVTSSEFTFQLQGRDAETKPENLQYSWRLDDDDWSEPSQETTVKVIILTNGKHLFEARAHDEAGNVDQTPAEAWFEVAIPVPTVKITPLPQSPLQTPEITFSFEVKEIGDWRYSWRWDETEWTPFSKEQSVTLTNLANGKHSFEVRARNESNNIETTPAQVWFEVAVDLQPPDTWITNPPIADIKSSQLTFNFLGKDNQTETKHLRYSWRYDKKEWSSFSTNTSATLPNLTNGAYQFEVKAKDEAGFEDEHPAQVMFTVAIDPLRPPVIITRTPPDIPLKIADVTFYFQVEGADAQMRKNLEYSWRLDEGEWSIAEGTSVELKNLTNGKHLFEVRAEDKSGNPPLPRGDKVEPTPAWVWFEVDVDRQPPETLITTPPDATLKRNGYTFNFSVTDSQANPDDLEYSWRWSRIPSQQNERTWSEFSKATSTSLRNLDDGIYLFEVKARDEKGNEDASPAQVHFEVAVNAPNTKIIESPKEPLTKRDFTFRFSGTDLQTPRALEYSWRWDGGEWSQFSKSTSVKLPELVNGDHWFEVRTRDSDRNIDQTPDRVRFELNIPPPPPFYMTKKFWYSVAAILGGIGILTILYFRFIRPIITMLRRFNPYRGDILVEEDKISGRGELLKEIIDNLSNGDNIMLHGERRIGKTTFLRQLEKRLKRPFIPIYIGIGGISEEHFFEEVMKEIVRSRHVNRDELVLQIEQDGAKYNAFKFREDFENILSQLQKQYDENATLVLLLDEIDMMISYKNVPFTLRELLGEKFKGQFMMVGAGWKILEVDPTSILSSLITIFKSREIPPPSHEDAQKLIKEPAWQYIDYSDGAVENIITYTGSRPRHILEFCGYIVGEISLAQKIIAILTKNKVKVNPEKVQQVFENQMIKEPVFQAYWNNLPEETRNAILESPVFQQAWDILQEGRLIDNTGKCTPPFQEWIRSRRL